MKCYDCNGDGYLIWNEDLYCIEDEWTEEDYLNVNDTSKIFWYDQLLNGLMVQLTICPYCDGWGNANV